MPAILSAHHQSRIRNLAMSAVYHIAAQEKCEASDVLDLIVTNDFTAPRSPFVRLSEPPPSQPEATSKPHAPAADAPAAPASAQTDGEAPPPCSSPSVKPIPLDAGEAQFRDPLDWEDEDGARSVDEIEAERASALPSPDAAPIKPAKAEPSPEELLAKIAACHAENPSWPARMIAKRIGTTTQRVTNYAYRDGIPIPTQKAYEKAQKAARNEQLKRGREKQPESLAGRFAEAYAEHPDWTLQQFHEFLGSTKKTISTYLSHARAAAADRAPAPKPNPQTPVLPSPPAIGGTLTQRVAQMHRMHPTWTSRMIANELGAPPNSVSTLLATARRAAPPEEPAPAFANRREMLDHYDAIAKRLGKPNA